MLFFKHVSQVISASLLRALYCAPKNMLFGSCISLDFATFLLCDSCARLSLLLGKLFFLLLALTLHVLCL